MARGNDAPDPGAAEDALIDLVASGAVTRVPAGAGALWLDPGPAASAAKRGPPGATTGAQRRPAEAEVN